MDTMILQYAGWLLAIFIVGFGALKIKADKQTPAVKELIGGIILGNLALVGITFFEPMREAPLLHILSEVAISYFLFRVGFGAALGELRSIGFRSLMVAIIGVLATFLLGILFIPFIFPGIPDLVIVFIAAALTSTSVGITVGVLKDLNHLETKGARIVLVAAVIDDIISVVLLAIGVSIAKSGTPDLGAINMEIARIVFFIVGGIILGMFGAKVLPVLAHKIHPHVRVKYAAVLLFFCLFYLGSKAIGLSPEVGAFLGGLVLERGYFDKPKDNIFHGKKVEAFFDRTSAFIVPIFFIMTGVQIHLAELISPTTLLAALALLAIAVVGKLLCGFVAGKKNEPWLVGIGMMPRGEFALIFANVGLGLAIISSDIFSALTLVVTATLLMAPAALARAVAQGKTKHS